MKIAIVGTGYVGLVSGTCFAEMGVDVTCVDINQEKIAQLKKGIIPIYEPGLDDMVSRNIQAGRLHFTTQLTDVLNEVEAVFIAVGTPPKKDGSADLKYVFDVAHTIGQNLQQYLLVVTKSTVPVGTTFNVKKIIQEELNKRGVDIDFDVASNPEFLKEGDAINDFMSPDRVIVGVENEQSKEILTKLYRPFLLNNFRVIFMDIPSSEMTKYAANAMLATRISFMNDVANLCEKVGADINMIRKGIGTDQRIGNKFLYAGCGYGGSCFPKDVRALICTAEENNYEMRILKAVDEVNERQKEILYYKLLKHFDDLQGKTIALWGLSYKPNTDDIRDATSLVVIEKLLKAGCKIRAYDPVAMPETQKYISEKMKDLLTSENIIYFGKDIYDTVLDADALLLITEWKEFRMPSWNVVKRAMKFPLVIDGRNIYVKEELKELGFKYEGIGN